MAYDGLTTFTQAFYYRFVSQNYIYYFYFVAVESLVIVILGHVFLLKSKNPRQTDHSTRDNLSLIDNERIQQISVLIPESQTFSSYIRFEASRNFVCTLLFWIITSVNYFLIEFELKYLNGGIFRDSMTSSLAEVAGCLIGGVLLLGSVGAHRVRLALVVVNFLPTIGAIGILICQSKNSAYFTAAFVLLTNLGIGSSYVV